MDRNGAGFRLKGGTLWCRRARGLFQSEIDKVVAKMWSHEAFHREVTGDLPVQIEISLGSVYPAVLHSVAHREGERMVIIVRCRDRR